MKKCFNCGAKLNINARFCSKCGTRVINDAEDPPDEEVQPEHRTAAGKRRDLRPFVIGIIVIAVIFALVNFFLKKSKYQQIDARELFNISFSGLDGFGTAEAAPAAYSTDIYSEMDEFLSSGDGSDAEGEARRLAEEYRRDNNAENEKISPYFALDDKTLLEAWSEAGNSKKAAKMRNALLDGISCELSSSGSLKNGDKLNVRVDCDEEQLRKNKIKLTDTEFSVTVSGLDAGTEIDPFAASFVSVVFKGIDGSGTAELAVNEYPDGIRYDIDPEECKELSNGDTVTVRAEYVLNDLQSAGDRCCYVRDGKYFILPAKDMTHEFSVSGLSEIQELDPFEGLSFEYKNAAPYLTVTRVITDGCDEYVKGNVRFALENNTDLDRGDTFIVKACDSWDALGSKGFRLAGEPDADGFVSKTFTVDIGMPSYVDADNGEEAYRSFGTKPNDILTGFRRRFSRGSRFISGIALDGRFETITDIELVDIYVGTNDKNSFDSIGWGEYYNRLIGLYKIDMLVTNDRGRSMRDAVYVAVYGDDIIFDGSGFGTDSVYLNSRLFRTMNDFRDAMVLTEGYTVTKCGGPSEADLFVP